MGADRVPVSRAKKTEIVRRRQLVGDLYAQGSSQTDISRELGVAQSTVCADLKAIFTEWRESAVRDFDVARGIELRKLEAVEKEAWQAWRQSLEPAESTKVTDNGGGKRAEKVVKQRVGDPRFLEQIQKCISARRALLGLDAPERVALTSPDGDEAYHSHIMAELMRLAEQSKDGPVVIDADYIEQSLNQQSTALSASEEGILHGRETLEDRRTGS